MEVSLVDYWSKYYLEEDADNWIFHVIIPTIFVTATRSKNEIGYDTKEELEYINAILKCSVCNQSISNKLVHKGIRVFILKKYDDNNTNFYYRCVVTTTGICAKCYKKRTLKEAIYPRDDVFDNITHILDFFSGIIELETTNKEVSGKYIWKKVYNMFIQNKHLINTKCATCNTRNNLFLCSECGFTKYCSKKCQKKDAKYHNTECPKLKTIPIISNIFKK